MLELGAKHYLLFDGDCGICTHSANWARHIDSRHLFIILPYQEFSEEDLKSVGIDYSQCQNQMQVITHTGKVWRGPFALNRFLIHYFPWNLLVVLMYLLPIFLLLEILGYWIIAKNRTRISRWFNLNACNTRR